MASGARDGRGMETGRALAAGDAAAGDVAAGDVAPGDAAAWDAPPGDALDAALELLGPFGLYQRYTLLMLCIPSVLAAMYTLNYIFLADQVPFRCVVPECESEPVYWERPAAGLLPLEPCRRAAPLPGSSTNLTCSSELFHPLDTVDCERRVYRHHDTIYADFDLGCREWMRTMVGTVRNAALPFALVLTGYISDSFGRRSAFCVFSACAGVLGIAKGFSVNYAMYLSLEFLEAALGYGFTSAAYVMIMEMARPSLRAVFACATGVAYGAGGVLLALLAARAGTWRRVLWVAHAPALLLPLYWLLLDESWRWLHARGRRADAAALVRKAARWNKVILDEGVMKNLYDEDNPGKDSSEKDDNPWLSLLRSRALLARWAVCAWCWVSVAFVYYGLTINSVALAGDKYVNFALNMAMEIVASLLLMMALERFGRKWSIFGSFLLCGVACVTPFFVSDEGAILGLFFVGKLSITFAFNSMYVFTAELFPTRVRSSALAACSLVGRLGSILAPQTPLLRAHVQAALYGACCAAAALAVLGAPETRRVPLPADVAAAEQLATRAPAAPPPPPPPARRVLGADT